LIFHQVTVKNKGGRIFLEQSVCASNGHSGVVLPIANSLVNSLKIQ